MERGHVEGECVRKVLDGPTFYHRVAVSPYKGVKYIQTPLDCEKACDNSIKIAVQDDLSNRSSYSLPTVY